MSLQNETFSTLYALAYILRNASLPIVHTAAMGAQLHATNYDGK